jgi:rod shape-determining protein MreB
MRFDYLARISLNNLRPLLGLFSADLAIYLGTVNTRIHSRDRGVVVNEPSAFALDDRTGEVRAVGTEAKEMLGRTSANIRVVRPLKDGVIADFKVTEKMLHYFLQKAHQRRTLVHPRIVISVPSEITQVEKRAVAESAYRAGAAEVNLVEQAMMAAIGAGMPITEPGGNLVVDIGGGTTDVAVISLSGMVYSRSLRIAGNHSDRELSKAKIQSTDRGAHGGADQDRDRLGVRAGQAANHGDQGSEPHRGYAKDDHGGRQRDPRGVERMRLDHGECY